MAARVTVLVMRAWTFPLALLLMTSLLPAAPAAPAAPAQAPFTFAVGELDYLLVEESGVPPSCSGTGTFTVAFQPDAARLQVAGGAVGCAPAWSLVSQCGYLVDRTVRCLNGGVDITLLPDGTFDYTWAGNGFHEEMHGDLTRIG